MIKRVKGLVIGAAVLLVIGVVSAKFYQAKLNRDRLLHVLNVESIPVGVSIVASAADVWTDEVLHFVLKLEDGSIDEVVSGREYTKTAYGTPRTQSHGGYTSHLPEFQVYHRYSTGEGLWGVWIETDKTETLAYVMFAAD
ncbi:MAG: hypothetical protein KDN22_13625 [Verrucomicrobiae bacterium]|nr:hypothetical protein [Verrucomicrobiae bacterium]